MWKINIRGQPNEAEISEDVQEVRQDAARLTRAGRARRVPKRAGRGGWRRRRLVLYREPPPRAAAATPARGRLASSPARLAVRSPPPSLPTGAARPRRRRAADSRSVRAAPQRNPLRPAAALPRPPAGSPPAGGPRQAAELNTDPPEGSVPSLTRRRATRRERIGRGRRRAGTPTAAPAGPAALGQQPCREAPEKGSREDGRQVSAVKAAPLGRARSSVARPLAQPRHSGEARTFQDGLH